MPHLIFLLCYLIYGSCFWERCSACEKEDTVCHCCRAKPWRLAKHNFARKAVLLQSQLLPSEVPEKYWPGLSSSFGVSHLLCQNKGVRNSAKEKQSESLCTISMQLVDHLYLWMWPLNPLKTSFKSLYQPFATSVLLVYLESFTGVWEFGGRAHISMAIEGMGESHRHTPAMQCALTIVGVPWQFQHLVSVVSSDAPEIHSSSFRRTNDKLQKFVSSL